MDAQSSEVHPLFPKPLLISKVIAPLKYKRNIVRAIEDMGDVEPIEVDPRTGIDEMEIEERRNLMEDSLAKIDSFLNALNTENIPDIDPVEIGDTEEDVMKFVQNVVEDKGSTIKEIIERKDEIDGRIDELNSILDLLYKFQSLNIEDTSILKDSRHVKTFLGTIFPTQLQRLYWEIDEITDSRYLIIDEQISKEDTILAIVVLQSDADAVDSKLKTLNFADVSIPKDVDLDGLTEADCNSEIEMLNQEKKELNQQLDELSKEIGGEFLATREIIEIELQRISIEQKMRRTEATCVMWAWIPDENQEEFKTVIHDATEGSSTFDFRKGDFDPEHTPSKVDNSEFMEPMRGIVTSFGTPGLNEVDPYRFVKYLFPILFAIMFADVGHGFVLMLIGIYFYRKKQKLVKQPKGISGYIYGGAELMIIMGFTAFLFGFAFNSFFGDETILWQFAPAKLLFENTTWEFFFLTGDELDAAAQAEHIEIERDYISFLIFSFAVGAVVIIMGLLLNLYQLKYYRHSDSELYAASTLLGVYIFAILAFVAGAIFGTVALLIFVVLTVLSLFSTLIIEFKAHGIDGLMLGVDHILSLMSNTFSFGRLLAMNTIHFVLALLPYLFIDMIPGVHVLNHSIHHWEVDIVIWIICAIIGTLIVVPVETTFSTLQSLRLNWVEFFGKFYKGDGVEFKPVQVKRLYSMEST